jgi:hypothetical protein
MMQGHIAGEENAVSSRQGASKAAGAKTGGHKGSARTGHSIGLVDILNLKSRLVIFATGKLTDTKTKSKPPRHGASDLLARVGGVFDFGHT